MPTPFRWAKVNLTMPDACSTRELPPPPIHNRRYHLAGLIILALNKVRHRLRGYRSPRGFAIEDVERGVSHDLTIVDRWLAITRWHVGEGFDIRGKSILELGPGADLGAGLYSLLLGAQVYFGADVNHLIKDAPHALYETLFGRIEDMGWDENLITGLRQELTFFLEGRPERLRYLHLPDFDLEALRGEGINWVVSNAAFEHFDDPVTTIGQLSQIVERGTVFTALVDMMTHTRWIRDVDPLNIYRYGEGVYNLFRFKGLQTDYAPSTTRKRLRSMAGGTWEYSHWTSCHAST